MDNTQPTIPPPFVCIFCQGNGSFTSAEHIVPHSLGNDLLVLSKGWVCDSCNNIFSSFENRAIFSSILGAERCCLGVKTKRNRPAHSVTHGVSWFSEPNMPPNIVSAEAQWEKIPLLLSPDGKQGKIIFPLHDETNMDIARVLLKMGVELMSVKTGCFQMTEAKKYLISGSNLPWPYFILRDQNVRAHLTSVLALLPEAHQYIRDIGFDIYLHEVEEAPIFFFEYGHLFAGINLATRDLGWHRVFHDWEISYVGCPIKYAEIHG